MALFLLKKKKKKRCSPERAGENRRQLHNCCATNKSVKICHRMTPRWNLLWQTSRWFGEHFRNFPSSPEMLKFTWILLLSPTLEKDGELESCRKKQDSHTLMLRSKSNGLPHFWVQSFYCSWNSSTDVHADEYFQLDRHLHSAERPHLKNYKVLLFNGAWTAEPTYLMRAACVIEPVHDWDSVFLSEKK